MIAGKKEIIRWAVLFGLLMIPVIYALFRAVELDYSWLKKMAYLGVTVVLLLLPALFLKARTYFVLEGIFNFLFFPIDIVSLYLNHQSVSAPFLQNIFHTNVKEAAELITALWPLVMVVILLWILYFLLAFSVNNEYIFGSGARMWLIAVVTVFFIAGVTTMTVFLKRIHPELPLVNAIREAVGLVEVKMNKIYPYNLYIHSTHLLKRHLRVKRLKERVSQFTFGIRPVAKHSPEIYVLVIGEASRYDHWSINGYERHTTPLLERTANILSFERVYTEANQTEFAVPILLTRATASCYEPAFTEKSIPEAFQEAGIWSGYISKQVSSDFTERIRQSCDYSYFYPFNFDTDGNFDASMIDQVRVSVFDTTQFYLLHSLGSHFRYEHRYPDDFGIFEPVLGKSASYSLVAEENKTLLVNAYDNSILYTDFFLHQLIQYIDSLNRPATVVYISDHGESFWDDDRKLSLHGSYQVSEAEYHVPMIVWFSDEYAALYPDKVVAMKKNTSKTVSSEVLMYSVLDLAGIGFAADSAFSICSSSLLSSDTLWVHTGAGRVEPLIP